MSTSAGSVTPDLLAPPAQDAEATALPAAAASREPRLLDAAHPWPGLDQYTEQSASYFFGREEEIGALFGRMRASILTVLYGQSGLGKSSLLQAGLFPRLREAHMLPVYIRLQHGETAAGSEASSLRTQTREEIAEAIKRAFDRGEIKLTEGASLEEALPTRGESLWCFLHRSVTALVTPDSEARQISLALIFDQFEELFTLGRDEAHLPDREIFLQDLADCVQNQVPEPMLRELYREDARDRSPVGSTAPSSSAFDRLNLRRGDYRVLITLREDYLADLQDLSGRMPAVRENQIRLATMDGWKALDSVVKPAGGLVEPLVARDIVELVAARRREGGAVSVAPAAEPKLNITDEERMVVDPALLSMICAELNEERIVRQERTITAQIVDDLLRKQTHSILARFYTRCFKDLATGAEKVKTWVEERLVNENGRRDLLPETTAERELAGLGLADPGAVIQDLVNHRLLRVTNYGNNTCVLELTHDVLLEVVCQSRRDRRAREAAEAAQAQAAEEQRKALEAAEAAKIKAAEEHRKAVEAAEAARLRAEEEHQKAVEAAEKRAAEEQEAKERAREREHQAKEREMNALERLRLAKHNAFLNRIVIGLTLLVVLSLVIVVLYSRETFSVGRGARATSKEFCKLAEELVDSDPFRGKSLGLAHLAVALKFDERNEEAARDACRLLLENNWPRTLTPPLISRPTGSAPPTTFLAGSFTPDGAYFAAIGRDGKLYRWKLADVQAGKIAPVSEAGYSLRGTDGTRPGTTSERITSASFSPNGDRLIVAREPAHRSEETIKDASREIELLEYNPAHGGPTLYRKSEDVIEWVDWDIRTVSWDADRSKMLIIPADYSWNVAICLEKEGHEYKWTDTIKEVFAAEFQPDGKYFAASGLNNIRLHNGASPFETIAALPAPPDSSSSTSFRAYSVSMAPDRQRVAAAGMGGFPRILGREPQIASQEIATPPTQPIFRLLYGPADPREGSLLAMAPPGAILLRHDGRPSEDVTAPVCFRSLTGVPSFSPDGKKLLVVSGNVWTAFDTLQVWDISRLAKSTLDLKSGKVPTPVPVWLPRLAESVASVGLNDYEKRQPRTPAAVKAEFGQMDKSGVYQAVWDHIFAGTN